MQGEVVRSLLTKLGYVVDDATWKEAEKSFKTLIGFSAAAGAAVAGVAAAFAKLKEAAVTAANAGADAQKAAQRLGLSVVEVQELAFAQNRTTTASAELERGLFQLERRAAAAAAGNKKMAAGFAALGVHVLGANGKVRPTIELLEDVSDKFQKLDPTKRAQAIFQLFGKGGTGLVDFLLKGSAGIEELRKRAHDVAVVMTEEDAKAGRQFSDALRENETAGQALSLTLGLRLRPAFLAMTEASTKWKVALRPLIEALGDGLNTAILGIIKAKSGFIEALSENRRFIELAASAALLAAGIYYRSLIPGLVAAGYQYVILGATALESAAVATIAWLAAAAPFIIAGAAVVAFLLLLEDLYSFIVGDDSVLEAFFQKFIDSPIDPNESWFITAIRLLAQAISFVVRSLDDMFRYFFDKALEAGGIWGGFKLAFSDAIAWIKRLWDEFWDGIVHRIQIDPIIGPLLSKLASAKDFVGNLDKGLDRAIRSVLPESLGGTPVAFANGQLGGAGPALAPLPALAAGGGTQQSLVTGGNTFHITVPEGADPQAIATRTSDAVDDALGRQLAAAARELEPRGVR